MPRPPRTDSRDDYDPRINKDTEGRYLVDRLPYKEWRTFVWGLVNGLTITDAYMQAYPDVSRLSARKNGSRLLKDPRIQEALDEILGEISRANIRRLRAIQDKALWVIVKALQGEDISKVQLDAAKDILDRTGLGKGRAGVLGKERMAWADLLNTLDEGGFGVKGDEGD